MANNNFGLALGFLVILLLWIYQRVRMPKMRSQRFYSMFGIEIFSILLIGAIIGGLFKIPLLQSFNFQAIALAVGLIMQNVATERELKHQFPKSPQH